MKRAAFLILISLNLVLPSLLAGMEGSGRLYPLPMAEAQEILFRWLTHSGFEVARTSLAGEGVRLNALKGEETWQVVLQPYSALASSIQAEYALSGRPDSHRVEELWTYLNGHTRELNSETDGFLQEGPTAKILSYRESIVCIKALVTDTPVQFSGFIVDPTGFILSTAHDLKGVRQITVVLSNGQEMRGKLVKMDPRRDLTLIQVHGKVNASIPLAEGRDLLESGERVYTIGCPGNEPGRIHHGIVHGSLRRANSMPLWQVDMETLPGGSGSPVFDSQGNLAGVVKGRFRGTTMVGFLIPLETVVEFLRAE